MTLTCALVGCGVRGAVWSRVLSEHANVRLAALVDPDLPRARALARVLDRDLACHDRLEPRRGEWDFVVLATPPELHFDQVRLCLDQGLHVLCEKPLVEGFAQGIALARRAEQTRRQLMVGMNFRYLASSQHLRQAVRERRFGALGYGSLQYVRHRDGRREDLNKYPLTMEHPMLLEQSVHQLDLLRYCYDQDPVRLCADTWNPPGSVYRHDSCVSVLMELAAGTRVNYLGTWTSGWNAMSFSWRSDFEQGMIWQRAQFGDVVETRLDAELGLTGARFKEPEAAEPLRPVPLAPQRPFVDDARGLLDEFVTCLDRNLPVQTSARDHLRTLAVLEACIASRRERRWVEIQALFERHAALDLWE